MQPSSPTDSIALSDPFGLIAIVGIGGVFPEAENLITFWENIAHKKSAVKTIPAERWIAPFEAMVSTSGEPDQAFTTRAALIDHLEFNSQGYFLPESFLVPLDPLFHLTLDAGRQAFEAASTHNLNPDRIGVVLAAIALPTDGASRWARQIIGDAYSDQILAQAGLKNSSSDRSFDSTRALSAQVTYLPAALLAAALGLKGSAVTLDAACASSLYAIKLACDQLMTGRLDAVLAGGVSRPDSLYTQVGFTQLRALSKSGRCAPFDQSADGLVVGEGAGIVLLKRLEDALIQNDQILGVIRGIGLSNDLRGNLLAPDSEGQVRAMRSAYRQCDWQPEDVDLIECHGAGTPLGDQTELFSLRRLWPKERSGHTCAIGSIKSMIGHLLTAAGAASLIKTVLAIGHKTLPPSINFDQAPAKSPLHQSPFKVQTESNPWAKRDADTPRRAAVNAFGFGGINAHLLLEEYLPAASSANAAYSIKEAPVGAENDAKIAIVGLDAATGPYQSLAQIRQALLDSQSRLIHRPAHRWKKSDPFVAPTLGDWADHGRYIAQMTIPPEEFRMPPAEIPDVIPQHLLMLRVAKQAARLAKVDATVETPRMGAVIGIDFDFEATDFHLRWTLFNQVEEWNHLYQLGLSEAELDAWRQQLADATAPPLSYSRTLGALGSMTASRIARELRLGGPCFTISAGSVSGIHALQMASDSLRKNETDTMLIGGVDFMGDVRAVVATHALDVNNKPPGDSAAAVVLKRLEDAQKDNDIIYAVVDGIGLAEHWKPETAPARTLSDQALQSALKEAGLTSDEITFTDQGDLHPGNKIDLPSVKADTAASFMALVTSSLALYHRRAPSTGNDSKLSPIETKKDAPLTAAVAAQSIWGQCGHAILSAHVQAETPEIENSQPVNLKEGIQLQVGKSPAPFPLPPLTASNEQTEPLSQTADAQALQQMVEITADIHQKTAQAHQRYLDLSRELTQTYAKALNLQSQLMGIDTDTPQQASETATTPLFTREQCLEFAIGSVANVLGSDFAAVDTYPARVRLPDEPLMLVDRILTVEGQKGVLGPGRVVTEHDVLPDAWYLDGGRAPVCISVEAGQADLFLSGYLGIDFQVKGLRTYRLLDATVTFHRSLPQPGETIVYDIHIDKFIRQGETHLFLFRFTGTIDGKPLITMEEGCAGFFTESEVKNSGGIILSSEMSDPAPDLGRGQWLDLVENQPQALSAEQLDALRQGDLAGCFGNPFENIPFPEALWLPGDRMRLIHRVAELDPSGGRFGRGRVRAEADISPDDWFLTCHFVDDMVMPGTLMYECCAQTLRVLLQAMGWVTDQENSGYEPVLGIESVLKCRGPVTPNTRQVVYEVEVREIGYEPEPFVIGDAYMYADGHRIVWFNNISMRLANVSKEGLTDFWNRHRPPLESDEMIAGRSELVEFATGRPSKVFGDKYRPFDQDRFLARLPAPPFLMMDAVMEAQAEPWVVKPGGRVTSLLNVQPDDWFFAADRSSIMPYGILLETALQPCGFLAAYMGSALLGKDEDLRFRNLGGTATIHQDLPAKATQLTTKVRLNRVSNAADMIIEDFHFEVSQNDRPVYEGTTYFGFFTPQALAKQEGIRDPGVFCWENAPHDVEKHPITSLEMTAPLTPEEAAAFSKAVPPVLQMPAKAFTMIDQIDCYLPDGGIEGLGYIKGSKVIDPDEWFFTAHFYQDPVWPGSLGLEAFIQLLKYAALKRWPERVSSSRFSLVTGQEHSWQYRGQVIPTNRRVTVEASITHADGAAEPMLLARGALHVDNLTIYTIDNFGICLKPIKGWAS